ncbi:NAD-dependent epimerase/dehydratase family protein [Cupriavidus alkaliphilus]|uniref:NAD-dependent epimerase/dehydratase family protein n=1 Tax=Cupriavidus alkaliphilus TaxID=942866 RepID=UPI00160A0224|nr:NAD-dependent epimerase/dehydratase family protein [Cupriavidus alkaliphilus]MBB2916085.1 UDP-glucose 4-epimerase [Cupriavidus alkaliphilus]
MTKVLLIGGGGFIGSRLALRCLAEGFSVRVADVQLPVADQVASRDIEYMAGDFSETSDLDGMLKGVDIVVHLVHRAMLLGLDSSMLPEIERNVVPAIKLFDRCLEYPGLRLLFVSSGGTVYGDPDERRPLAEHAALRPISVYGTSKSMIEKALGLYVAQRGLRALVVRPGNAYGPGQVPFKGQGLIPTVMASALQGKPVTIYGDGTAIRDYIHVEDIAEGIVAAMTAGRNGEAYNIGTGRGVSINSLINDHIRPLVVAQGLDIDLRYVESRGVDVSYNILGTAKLTNECGFTAKTQLEDGIAETWNWILRGYSSVGQ